MDSKKKISKDQKWLLYVFNARIEERNNMIDEMQEQFKDSGYSKWTTLEVIQMLETFRKKDLNG